MRACGREHRLETRGVGAGERLEQEVWEGKGW